MKTFWLTCVKPTKTIEHLQKYQGVPVRKSTSSGSFNGNWTTNWEECDLHQCTSYRVFDKLGITRYISKTRFSVEW